MLEVASYETLADAGSAYRLDIARLCCVCSMNAQELRRCVEETSGR